jgi:hypothetical protein
MGWRGLRGRQEGREVGAVFAGVVVAGVVVVGIAVAIGAVDLGMVVGSGKC